MSWSSPYLTTTSILAAVHPVSTACTPCHVTVMPTLTSPCPHRRPLPMLLFDLATMPADALQAHQSPIPQLPSCAKSMPTSHRHAPHAPAVHPVLQTRTLAPLTAWPLLNLLPQPMLRPVAPAFVHMHQCSTIPPTPAPVVCCCQLPLAFACPSLDTLCLCPRRCMPPLALSMLALSIITCHTAPNESMCCIPTATTSWMRRATAAPFDVSQPAPSRRATATHHQALFQLPPRVLGPSQRTPSSYMLLHPSPLSMLFTPAPCPGPMHP